MWLCIDHEKSSLLDYLWADLIWGMFEHLFRDVIVWLPDRANKLQWNCAGFTRRSDARPGCLLSNVLFDFVIGMVMKVAVSSFVNGCIDKCSDRHLSDFEYADGVVLVSEDISTLQFFLHRLNDSTEIFGMRFTLLKCKTPSHNWNGLVRSRTLFLKGTAEWGDCI